MSTKPAVLLDRDGTINIDKGYVYKKKILNGQKVQKTLSNYLTTKGIMCLLPLINQELEEVFITEKT